MRERNEEQNTKTYLYKLSKNDIRKNKKKGLRTHNKWWRKVEFHKAPSSNMKDKNEEHQFMNPYFLGFLYKYLKVHFNGLGYFFLG